MGKYKEKKIFCMIASVLIGTVAIGGTVCASADHRNGAIGSHGIVNYGNGKVVINAADLITLSDEMDNLEVSYKTEIADSLMQIGTYIQQDGRVSHSDRADVDPQHIKFNTLIDGILQSQSVAHLAGTQASDTHDLVYYKFEKNNILEVTNEDTGMPVYIVPATADNLTAQTAAWVDGHCLEGNGSDNYYFYQKGFIEGYAAKVGAEVKYNYDDSGKIESAELIFPG